jgi:alpha-beta hydrolase superfamily lysophospholipase
MWHGAWCWVKLARYLAARGFACYLLDLPGHGRRRGMEKLTRLRLGDYAREVERAVRALRARLPAGTRLVWVGHSLGGAVLHKLLEWNTVSTPDALVFVSPVPPAGALGLAAKLFFSRHIGRVVWATLRSNLYLLIRTPRNARALLFSPAFPLARVHRYLDEGLLWHDSALAYYGMCAMIFGWGGRARKAKARLDAAGCPVLVLLADQDAIIPHKNISATVAAYGAGLRSFPLAHDLMLDVGAEKGGGAKLVGQRHTWRDVAVSLCQWLSSL